MDDRFTPQLLSLSRGFMHSRAFLTAIELGLFQALGDESLSAEELAARLDADRRATDILCIALAAMNLLEKHGETFRNAAGLPLGKKGGEADLAFRHAVQVWEQWSQLTQVVKSGRPAVYDASPTPEWNRVSALAMRQYAALTGEALAGILDLSAARTLLDLGGGTGACAMALAQRYPNLRAVIFDDNEAALAAAEEESAARGLEQRVTGMHGDFMEDDLGGPYDIVLLSSIVCLLGEEENRRLLARVHDALNDGGRVVIRDALVNPDRTTPPRAAIFSLHMLLNTAAGRSYSHAEVSDWLQTAGYERLRRYPLDEASVIEGTKPPASS